MRKLFFIVASLIILASNAQNDGLTNTSVSKYAKMSATNIDAVHWTNGFWGERFGVFKDTMILSMWNTLNDTTLSHSFQNFQVAAGELTGRHQGPPFHDGDFYKWFEAVASVYAVTKDPKLDALMDKIISTIVKVQRADGYIHTPVIIAELNRS